MRKIIVIVGPTGVGKTKLSIELAKIYDALVINGDSMQVYQGLDIGTAKITASEKGDIPHFLFDIKNIHEEYTVYQYQLDVRNIIDNNPNTNIIIVGGTGLYIKAALYNYQFAKEKKLNVETLSDEELYNVVKNKYPDIEIHKNNRRRLERYLKVDKQEKEKLNLLYDNLYFIGLTTDRDHLYEIINKRVDKMFADGLVTEVKSFYDKKINNKPLLTGIGYKELYKYFDGDISLEEAKALIKQKTRRYAKRQYTWFNNQMHINWFEVNFDNFNLTIDEVNKFIKKI